MNSIVSDGVGPVVALWPFLLAGATLLANAADAGHSSLPKEDDYSASGLEMQCHPGKTNFVMGEPLIFACAITNTTDSDKRISLYVAPRLHFLFAKAEASWMSGLEPEVAPQIRPPIRREAGALLLPPHSMLEVLFTTRSSRPGVYRWLGVYDPHVHGGGFFGAEALEKAKQACVFSNTFEYEVTAAESRK